MNGSRSANNPPINKAPLSLTEYANGAAETDVLDKADAAPILQGLYGEVGGIMSTAKKHIREKSAYPGFKRAAEEEFGDTLWYLAALCRRLNIPFVDVLNKALSEARNVESARGSTAAETSPSVVDSTLFRLGRSAAMLLGDTPDHQAVFEFAKDYVDALHAANLDLAAVARRNLQKVRGAFLEPRPENLVDFDAEFDEEEQLPRQFRIRIKQRATGKSYLQWNGVFIGDPLTDNIADPDGYRFHDVFHLSYAAILHWSPVMRALIKQKRKSKPDYDENQDGGRAIVVEEGLTAWLFGRAKELNFFEGQNRISLEILKIIAEFVAGYEVSKCPLKLWERAILDGYAAFRQLRSAKGGWIIGDRSRRTIRYAPLESGS